MLNLSKKKGFKKNEVIITPKGFYSLEPLITRASKSLCKIMVSSNRMSSGFLIQLFKQNKKFLLFND